MHLLKSVPCFENIHTHTHSYTHTGYSFSDILMVKKERGLLERARYGELITNLTQHTMYACIYIYVYVNIH